MTGWGFCGCLLCLAFVLNLPQLDLLSAVILEVIWGSSETGMSWPGAQFSSRCSVSLIVSPREVLTPVLLAICILLAVEGMSHNVRFGKASPLRAL